MNKKKFTFTHRALHWLIALSMTILFITGFLRMYWMNKNSIISIIEKETNSISSDTMKNIAVEIRNPMWEWHEIFSYVIIVSFIVRLFYIIFRGLRFTNPFSKNILIKECLQGVTYIYFYTFILISSVTGLFIQYHVFSNYKEEIEMIHKWGIYWFPIFILLHLTGIIIAEHSNKKGITSKMIGGD